MVKKSEEKESFFKNKLLMIGLIVSLLLNGYALIDKGLFSSFFVSPSTFIQKIENLEKRIINDIEEIEQRATNNREVLIRLEAQLLAIQKSIDRVENKVGGDRDFNYHSTDKF